MTEPRPLDWTRLPLRGRCLIEASAGTGKTWNIAQIHLRLLLETDVGIERILVCTFTEAAAGELRGRLRARLLEAERALSATDGEGGGDAALASYLRELSIRAEGGVETLRRRLRLARLDFDRAPISTIHAFFARAQREHPFESGAPFQPGEFTDGRDWLDDCLEDFKRATLQAPAAARPAYAEALLGMLGNDRLRREVEAVLNAPTATLVAPDADGPEAVAGALEALGQPSVRQRLREIAEDVGGDFAYKARAAFRSGLHALLERLEASSGPLTSRDFEKLSAESAGKAQAVKARRRLADEPALAPLFELAEALPRRERLLAGLARHAAAEWCRRELPLRLQRARRASFASIVEGLAQAIEGPGGDALADALFEAWPHALIDEFQDTDQQQWAVFDRIYRDGRGSLHLIGDPKQAIYGFRGGDVEAYLRAAASVEGHYTLDTNWRSDPAYLGALNGLYARAGDGFAHPRIGYHPVHAGQRPGRVGYTLDGAPLSRPLHFHLRTPEKGGRPETQERLTADALEACAGAIAHLLSDPGRRIGAHPLQPSDIAVLLPRNADVESLRGLLARRGVPAVGAGDGSVLETPVAEELALVLHAVLSPDNDALLRAALGTRLLGHRFEDLRDLAEDPAAWPAQAQRFERWRELWYRHGPLSLTQALLAERAATELHMLDGERRLTDLRHLGELLQARVADCYGPHELLDWFDRARAEPEGDGASDERRLRIESDAARVQLMTLHRSKGLQFGIVFLPLAWRGQGGQAPGIARVHDATGGRLFDFGGPDFEARLGQHHLEQLQERLRLLYVGLTRAEHACHVFWVERGAKTGDTASVSALDWLLARVRGGDAGPAEALAGIDGIAVEADWPGGAGVYRPARQAVPPALPAPPLPARRPLFRMHSFSGLLRQARDLAGEAERGAEDERGAAPPASVQATAADPTIAALAALRGPRFGNAVHHLFETLDPARPLWPDQAGLVQRALLRHAVRLPERAADSLLPALAAMIERSLDAPLAAGLSLRALPPERRVAEFGFHLPLRQVPVARLREVCTAHGEPHLLPAGLEAGSLHGLLSGFADLVFEHEGRFHVLDYKTNRLGADAREDYAPHALEAAMREHHYPLQALLYTVALHRHLRRRLPGYDPAVHLGESLYLFVRALGLGPDLGVWRHRFDPGLVQAVDDAFAGAQGRAA